MLGAISISIVLMRKAAAEMRRRFFTEIFFIILSIKAIVGSSRRAAMKTAVPMEASVPPRGVIIWIM